MSGQIKVTLKSLVRVVVSVDDHPLDTHFLLSSLGTTVSIDWVVDRLVLDANARHLTVERTDLQNAIQTAVKSYKDLQ